MLLDLIHRLEPHRSEDILRLWVLVFGLGVLWLYARHVWRLCKWYKRARRRERARHGGYRVLTHIFRGQVARGLCIAVFIGAEMWEVFNRLGNPVMDHRTPVAQVSLILALFAWHELDRRPYFDTDEGIDRLINHAHGRAP